MIMIADDIMVVGKQPNHKDHDQALTTLLETARKCNMWLNYEKLQYKQTEVEFFVETYTVNGCKPAKGKVQAIAKMPAPSCKKEVQSFIGMINYLSKFSARLSELALPIREFAKDKVAFNCILEHQAAFKLVKMKLLLHQYLHTMTLRKPLYYRQMPVSMVLGSACTKMKNLYTLLVKL